MTQPADTIKTWATDVGVRPPVAGASNVQAALSAVGGGGWVPVPVSVVQADWDVAGAVGTWTFPGGGIIQQTDSTQTAGSLQLIAPLPLFAPAGIALRVDVRIDALDGGGNTGFTFTYGETAPPSTFFPSTTALASLGTESNTPSPNTNAVQLVVANQTLGRNFGFPDDAAFHTLFGSVAGVAAQVQVDGVTVDYGLVTAGGLAVDSPTAPTAAPATVLTLQADGAVSFRHLHCWVIVPATLP